MRKQHFWSVALGLIFVITAGCKDDDPEKRIIINQNVKDFVTGDPLDGVEICVYGRDDLDCATSDANGSFALEAPAGADISIHYTRADYWPMIVEAHTPDTDWTPADNMNMNTELEAELLMASSGFTLDSAKGHVLVSIFDSVTVAGASGIEGASIDLSGGDGVTAYLGTNSLLDASLTATTTNGNAMVLNVEPGQYILTVSHATMTCYPIYAVQGAADSTFQLHVIPVATTWVNIYCE